MPSGGRSRGSNTVLLLIKNRTGLVLGSVVHRVTFTCNVAATIENSGVKANLDYDCEMQVRSEIGGQNIRREKLKQTYHMHIFSQSQ